MGKLITYVLVLTGLFILLHITGIIGIGEGSIILDMALNPQNITTTDIYVLVFTIMSTIVIGGAVLALVGSRILQFDLLAIASLCLFLLSLFQEIIMLWQKIEVNSNIYVASMIVSPFIVMFPLIIVEFWRGRD